ncbi:uncharacterized protein T551_03165 [Pneumocystis jirovecii RU7]|uniref:Uncharacterized protein n=1 Tax=Pneumocystis jirovecii (strain RU7) TaxID=1408657 RepID=A0A0W4ZFL0_PNEJ7|nr:uncharacterized protein T551_03165 [Pneumocystis jirovecii RU7]KTW27171.1 hypothetical protein T551_03165 [Pneumocystis jirovecii RU7]
MSEKPLRRQLFGLRTPLVPSVSIASVFGQAVSTLYEDVMDPSSFTALQFLETPVPGTEEHDQKALEQAKQAEALRKIYTSEQFQHKGRHRGAKRRYTKQLTNIALGEAVRENLKRNIQALDEDEWMFVADDTRPVWQQ